MSDEPIEYTGSECVGVVSIRQLLRDLVLIKKYAMDKNYDIAVQFDGDGQHSAKYVKYLVDEIENGIDIAIGSRFVTVKKPWSLRMLGSRVISACIFLTTGKKITDPTSGMRAYNKNIIKNSSNRSINY